MAASATLVSVEEYLRMADKSAFEFKDGTLTQKGRPTWKHSPLQLRIGELLNAIPGIVAGSELTVEVRQGSLTASQVVIPLRQPFAVLNQSLPAKTVTDSFPFTLHNLRKSLSACLLS